MHRPEARSDWWRRTRWRLTSRSARRPPATRCEYVSVQGRPAVRPRTTPVRRPVYCSLVLTGWTTGCRPFRVHRSGAGRHAGRAGGAVQRGGDDARSDAQARVPTPTHHAPIFAPTAGFAASGWSQLGCLAALPTLRFMAVFCCACRQVYGLTTTPNYSADAVLDVEDEGHTLPVEPLALHQLREDMVLIDVSRGSLTGILDDEHLKSSGALQEVSEGPLDYSFPVLLELRLRRYPRSHWQHSTFVEVWCSRLGRVLCLWLWRPSSLSALIYSWRPSTA